MLTIPPTVKIYLATGPTDMRRSFDGLAATTTAVIGEDPMSGHMFVFRNKRGDRVKVLCWDRTGYWLWYKRLEKGTFRFPESPSGRVTVDAVQLSLILEGIDLAGSRQQARYMRQPA